jgi:hypothetical protein
MIYLHDYYLKFHLLRYGLRKSIRHIGHGGVSDARSADAAPPDDSPPPALPSFPPLLPNMPTTANGSAMIADTDITLCSIGCRQHTGFLIVQKGTLVTVLLVFPIRLLSRASLTTLPPRALARVGGRFSPRLALAANKTRFTVCFRPSPCYSNTLHA